MRRAVAAALGIGVLAWVSLACGTGTPPPGDGDAAAVRRFSGTRAIEVLEALHSRAAKRRNPDKRAKRVRRTLRKHLEHLGLAVEESRFPVESDEPPAPQRSNLLARIPGSPRQGTFLVVSPYAGAWAVPGEAGPAPCSARPGDLSGAAMTLELARLLAADPLPYDTWLAFVDDRAPLAHPDRLFPGSRALVHDLVTAGALERVRLGVFLAQVAEPHVRVARDLRSHRTFRERFFRAARRLGGGEAFPAQGGFASVQAGHRAFLEQGATAVVALVGRAEGPGSAEAPEGRSSGRAAGADCSAASLEQVGRGVDAGLRDIAALLTRIDALAGEGAAGEAAGPVPASAAGS